MPRVFYCVVPYNGLQSAHVKTALLLQLPCCSNVSILGMFPAGALRVQRGHTNIISSYLADNHAHRHGGAVFLGTLGTDEAQAKREGRMQLQDIKECYNGNDRPALLLSRCSMTSNTAEASGGEPAVVCTHVSAVVAVLLHY
jgi:hypothetical protein